jgi:hypothetical protein
LQGLGILYLGLICLHDLFRRLFTVRCSRVGVSEKGSHGKYQWGFRCENNAFGVLFVMAFLPFLFLVAFWSLCLQHILDPSFATLSWLLLTGDLKIRQMSLLGRKSLPPRFVRSAVPPRPSPPRLPQHSRVMNRRSTGGDTETRWGTSRRQAGG